MKKIISIVLAVSIMAIIFPGNIFGNILPEAAAADGGAVQISNDGRIQVKDGQLIVPGGAAVTYHTKQIFSGNYTIEMKVAVRNQAVGLLFGSGSPNPPLWILALVQPYGLWAHMPGNWSTVNKVASSSVQANTPVVMKIDINGTAVTTYLNGVQVNTCTLSAENTTGSLGLRFHDSESGDIDYIKVTQNGQVIWNDDFNTLDGDKWDFPVNTYTNLNQDMAPIWQGTIAYNESVWPIARQDGTVADMQLLYKADDILSVQNSEHTVTYTKGTDYSLAEGKLRILPGSKIPVTSYASYHPSSGTFPSKTGGYIYWPGETAQIITSQISVTYRHSDTWTFDAPQDKSSLLPTTINKLKNNQALNIVFYGDSITEGFNTSGKMGVSPYMPIWSSLVTKSIQRAYPGAVVNATNTGVAGKDTEWGLQNIEANVCAYNPDLVVLAFGMNDGSGNRSVKDYITNINSMINAIRAKNSHCEIVLVTTMLPNPDSFFVGNQEAYEPALLALQKEGIAVADVTNMHRSLLTRKAFSDMSGNNINHPNDYLVRGYAQTVSQTIIGDFVPYTDIHYADGSNLAAQTLDIQLPPGGSGPYPVVVYIHGGAWVIGDKTDNEARGALNAALAQGYAVVSINYRLAQNAQWPAQIYDCKAAVRFLRANAEKYHLDADKIAVWGASAGAHLAQFMGVTNGDKQYEDLAMGNASYSSDVQAVISYYGISDLTAWKEPSWITGITTTGKDARTTLLGDTYTKEAALDASPVSHISKSSVPMLLAHGMNDTVVNADESTVFAEKLTESIGFNRVDTYFPASAEHADTSFWNKGEPVKAALNFLQKRFSPTKNLDSSENTRPDSWWVDLSAYTKKYLNVPYANTSGNGTQKLHVVLPKTGEGPYPLVVFVHGGGFAGGNSSGNSVLYTAEGALQALDKGYAVAMIDYRLAPEAYFPKPIHDVKAAIRYLRANADTYQLDPYNFAIWGESAGGLIVDFIGTTNGNPDYEDLSMGNAEYSSEVQAVVSWYAITDMTTPRNAQYCQNWLGFSGTANESITKDASPINHVTPSAPPFYIQHGMADNEVEYQDSVHLYEKLARLSGNPNTKLELFPGITHAVKIFLSKPNAKQITTWLDTVLVNHAPDTSQLSERLISARALNLNRYSSLGQQEFSDAVSKAQSVLNVKYASDQLVQEADSALAAAMEYLRLTGDMDEDKKVTVSDVVSLRSHIMSGNSTDVKKSIGDLDSDGKLTVSDVVALRTYIMKGTE